MIKLMQGNIFDSGCNTLVNPVNCVGVMGAGLAKEFKKRFPKACDPYFIMCNIKALIPGLLVVGKDRKSGKIIVHFPTKKHWKDKSQLSFINDGLDYFVAYWEEFGTHSVAFPLLGCGLGGLKKHKVLPLMLDKLDKLEIIVEIYCG